MLLHSFQSVGECLATLLQLGFQSLDGFVSSFKRLTLFSGSTFDKSLDTLLFSLLFKSLFLGFLLRLLSIVQGLQGGRDIVKTKLGAQSGNINVLILVHFTDFLKHPS